MRQLSWESWGVYTERMGTGTQRGMGRGSEKHRFVDCRCARALFSSEPWSHKYVCLPCFLSYLPNTGYEVTTGPDQCALSHGKYCQV